MRSRLTVASLFSAVLVSQLALPVAHAEQASGDTKSSMQKKKESESKLDDMVVTATRVKESKKDIPASI